MRLRKLDATIDPNTGAPTRDMMFGHGVQDYWQDVPDAPAQLTYDRLMLWTGQWFLDLDEGTPYRTEVLGRNTDATRDRAIRVRILATQGVTGISAYGSQLDRDKRKGSAQVTISTAYGSKTLSVVSPTADVRLYR